jgi:hypothetical protein
MATLDHDDLLPLLRALQTDIRSVLREHMRN